MRPRDTVAEFVARINAHDVEGLCSLMTDDHAFVDALDNRMSGRLAMAGAWEHYFSVVPDYWIKVETALDEDGKVALFGTAGGTYAALRSGSPTAVWAVPAAWLADVREGKVAVWRVYADNLPLRRLMGLEGG